MIIDNLVMTKNMQQAELYAFCILPDHVHILISPGEKGLSKFMHSFKKNCSRDVQNLLGRSDRLQVSNSDVIGGSSSDVIGGSSSDFRIAAAAGNGNGGSKTAGHPQNHNQGSKTAGHPQNHNQGPTIAGPFMWQKGYHDERIRSNRQRSAALAYIEGNGVRHGFVTEILDWPWTSLHFEHLLDPMEWWIEDKWTNNVLIAAINLTH